MATIKTVDGEVEKPLILNDPTVAKEMRDVRDKLEKIWGVTDLELCGLVEGPCGTWQGVFRKKPGA
jgi:hypothetical protein